MRQLTGSGGPFPRPSPHVWLKVFGHVPWYSMGSFDLPGHPLHFAGEMRPAYQAREPACLLSSTAVIRLRSSWPGRIPRPLFFSVAPEKSGEKVPRTSDLRDLNLRCVPLRHGRGSRPLAELCPSQLPIRLQLVPPTRAPRTQRLDALGLGTIRPPHARAAPPTRTRRAVAASHRVA